MQKVKRILVSRSPMSTLVKLLTNESMVTNSAALTSFFFVGKIPVAWKFSLNCGGDLYLARCGVRLELSLFISSVANIV